MLLILSAFYHHLLKRGFSIIKKEWQNVNVILIYLDFHKKGRKEDEHNILVHIYHELGDNILVHIHEFGIPWCSYYYVLLFCIFSKYVRIQDLKLHILDSIKYIRMLNGFDHEFGATNEQKNKIKREFSLIYYWQENKPNIYIYNALVLKSYKSKSISKEKS